MYERTEQGNNGKEHDEDNSEVEDQTLYATSCLKH